MRELRLSRSASQLHADSGIKTIVMALVDAFRGLEKRVNGSKLRPLRPKRILKESLSSPTTRTRWNMRWSFPCSARRAPWCRTCPTSVTAARTARNGCFSVAAWRCAPVSSRRWPRFGLAANPCISCVSGVLPFLPVILYFHACSDDVRRRMTCSKNGCDMART